MRQPYSYEALLSAHHGISKLFFIPTCRMSQMEYGGVG